MDSKKLARFLLDVRTFLDNDSFTKDLSFRHEKPLFEKALSESLKAMEFEGITASQKAQVRKIIQSLEDSSRSDFIAHLAHLGYENPAAFDSWYVAPEVFFTPPKRTPLSRSKTPPSPPSSITFYSSPASPAISKKPILMRDPLPRARKPATLASPTKQHPAAHIARKQQPLPAQERRKTKKKLHSQAASTAPQTLPRKKAPQRPPTFTVDFSNDTSSEIDMPSLYEIKRSIDPEFTQHLYKVERSSSRPPSPTLSDFAVDENFFVTSDRESRRASHASSLSEVGLPSDTEFYPNPSSVTAQLTTRHLSPPLPRPVSPPFPYLKPRPASPVAPTRARRSSISSSSSNETPRRPRPRRPLKPAKFRREKQQPKTFFSKYEKEAARLLARSEELLTQQQAPARSPGFVEATE